MNCMKILRNENENLSSFLSANQNEIEKLFERMYDAFDSKI